MFSSRNGLILQKPSSINVTGTSATISTNGSVSFTAVTSISLNNVFSNDYISYMGVLWGKAASNSGVYIRFRSNSVDWLAGYWHQYLYFQTTSVTTANTTYDSDLDANAAIGDYLSGNVHFIGQPSQYAPTVFRSIDASNSSSPNPRALDAGGGIYTNANFDGMTYNFAVATSGRIAIYGMRS